MKKFKVIHQFTPSVAFGDSISNAVLYAQRLLLEMGYKSNIYIGSNVVDLNFKNYIYHISEYEENEEQLLLYHHSIGHKDHEEILKFKDKKILIYHNITPSHFFKKNIDLSHRCDLGRKQLENISNFFLGSIADSSYNKKELRYYGFKNTKVLPILIDFEKDEKVVPNERLVKQYSKNYNLLFVGRVVPHKAQLELIDVAFWLKLKGVDNFIFHIVGGVGDNEYMKSLNNYVTSLNLVDNINFTNKVDSKDLAAYYKLSDLYLSVSNHEGFGMPLIEAMKYDIPVLAYNAGGVSTTVPSICLLDRKAPSFIADTIIELQNSPLKRLNIVKEQKTHLKQFSCEKIYKKFQKYLNSIEEKID